MGEDSEHERNHAPYAGPPTPVHRPFFATEATVRTKATLPFEVDLAEYLADGASSIERGHTHWKYDEHLSFWTPDRVEKKLKKSRRRGRRRRPRV